MSISAVALDMVGVILNEEKVVSTTLYDMLPSSKQVSREELKRRYDEGLRLGRLTDEDFWADTGDIPWQELEAAFLSRLRFNEGAAEAIFSLASRYRVAVVSDLPARWSWALLDRIKVRDKVAVGIFADENAGARKKDGSLFRVLLDRLDCAADEVLMVDDTLANVQVASDLGLDVLWFEREGRDANGWPSSRTIRSFDELPNRLPAARAD